MSADLQADTVAALDRAYGPKINSVLPMSGDTPATDITTSPASAFHNMEVVEVEPDPYPTTVTTTPTTRPARVSDMLLSTPHSSLSMFSNTNLHSVIVACISVCQITAISLPMQHVIVDRMDSHMTSATAFVAALIVLYSVRLLRAYDEEYVRAFRIMQPSAIAFSCVILFLAPNGDTGAFTIPLVAAMLAMSNSTEWFVIKERPRPSALDFFLSCVPVSIVLIIMCYVPPYTVAIPGRLLRDHPKTYTAWTGVGFPLLAIAIRTSMLMYVSQFGADKVKSGRWTPKDAMKFFSTISFAISTSLLFSNITLMFLSKNKEYAAVSGLVSVVTEVAGKIYAVWVLPRKLKLKLKLKRSVTRKIGGKKKMKEKRGEEVEEGEDGGDEEMRKMLEDALTICGIRWTNELVAEKCCILVCSFASRMLIESPHSLVDHVIITLIFVACEVIADALLVHVLGKFWGVPFLRLPRDHGMGDGKYWMDALLVGTVVSGAAFFFVHSHGAAEEWFPEVNGGSVGNQTTRW
jgi:hypothetical protein